MKKKSGLGANPFELGIFAPTEPTQETQNKSDRQVALSDIHLPKEQPRRYFDPEKMQQLVQSVQAYGILEPLLVRPLPTGGYELVAGERRYRAAKEVGLEEVPVAVRTLTDDEAVQIALVENLQREDLNPVEETEGVLKLLSFKLEVPIDEVPQLLHRLAKSSDNVVGNDKSQVQTIESVFKVVGRMSWESFATHRLPLLRLPDPVLDALRAGKIEYTKARVIARVKDEGQRDTLLEGAIAQNLSLNEIKQKIQSLQSPTLASDPLPEVRISERYTAIGKKLKKSEALKDPKKQQRLEKLLSELEKLIGG